MAGPPAPKGAGPAGRRLWREVTRAYVLGEHELTVLVEAVRVKDLCEQLHERLVDGGLADGDGAKNWVLPELRMQRHQLAQLLAVIRIPTDLADQPSTPATTGDEPAPRTQRRRIRGVYLVGGQQ